jgi:hypothetical protein
MRAGIQGNRTFGQRHRADVSHSIERSIIDFSTAYNDTYTTRQHHQSNIQQIIRRTAKKSYHAVPSTDSSNIDHPHIRQSSRVIELISPTSTRGASPHSFEGIKHQRQRFSVLGYLCFKATTLSSRLRYSSTPPPRELYAYSRISVETRAT